MSRYNYLRYDHRGSLRPSWRFALLTIVFTRHLLMIVAVGAGQLKGGGRGAAGFAGLMDPLFLIGDLPAVLLAVAAFHRRPEAGAGIRRIWAHGRALLLASAVIYLGLFAYVTGLDWRQFGIGSWIGLAVTAAATGYVLMSRFLRDLFADFPPATAGKK